VQDLVYPLVSSGLFSVVAQSLTENRTAVDLLLSDLQSGGFLSIKMDAIQTHPSNAAQAKAFTAPGSLSFPGAAGELTPPSMGNDKNQAMNGGQVQGGQATNGNGVTPATPAATPAATQSSGLVPTLQ
jgi:hypothetical protein